MHLLITSSSFFPYVTTAVKRVEKNREIGRERGTVKKGVHGDVKK